MRHSYRVKLRLIKNKGRKVKSFEKRLWAQANKEHYPSKNLNWKPKEYSLAIFEKEKIIGVSDSVIEAGVMYIKMIIVGENQRNKGVGEMLMKKMEAIARKQKVHKIYLYTGKTWGAAKFYRRLGYEITGNLPRHFGNVDFVVFSKFL